MLCSDSDVPCMMGRDPSSIPAVGERHIFREALSNSPKGSFLLGIVKPGLCALPPVRKNQLHCSGSTDAVWPKKAIVRPFDIAGSE